MCSVKKKKTVSDFGLQGSFRPLFPSQYLKSNLTYFFKLHFSPLTSINLRPSSTNIVTLQFFEKPSFFYKPGKNALQWVRFLKETFEIENECVKTGVLKLFF